MPPPHSNLLNLLYDITYNMITYTILRSASFDRWLGRLRDHRAVNRLLCGGDKDSQRRDIERAKRMATERRS